MTILGNQKNSLLENEVWKGLFFITHPTSLSIFKDGSTFLWKLTV